MEEVIDADNYYRECPKCKIVWEIDYRFCPKCGVCLGAITPMPTYEGPYETDET